MVPRGTSANHELFLQWLEPGVCLAMFVLVGVMAWAWEIEFDGKAEYSRR